jgi:hypothetical protein
MIDDICENGDSLCVAPTACGAALGYPLSGLVPGTA